MISCCRKVICWGANLAVCLGYWWFACKCAANFSSSIFADCLLILGILVPRGIAIIKVFCSGSWALILSPDFQLTCSYSHTSGYRCPLVQIKLWWGWVYTIDRIITTTIILLGCMITICEPFPTFVFLNLVILNCILGCTLFCQLEDMGICGQHVGSWFQKFCFETILSCQSHHYNPFGCINIVFAIAMIFCLFVQTFLCSKGYPLVATWEWSVNPFSNWEPC